MWMRISDSVQSILTVHHLAADGEDVIDELVWHFSSTPLLADFSIFVVRRVYN